MRIKLRNILQEIQHELICENAELEVIEDLKTRIDTNHFNAYMTDENWESDEVDDAFEYYLDDEFGISIDEYGIIDFTTLEDVNENIIGDNFVKLYHFAPKKYETDIRKNGLIAGKSQTNPYQNSYSGIYLTTEVSGNVIDGYIYHINQKHGDAIMVTVKMQLDELQADPDDQDITSGRTQFITPNIPAHRILGIESAY